jgi:hypothetical protein
MIHKLIARLLKRRAKRLAGKRAVRLLKKSAREGVKAVRASINSSSKSKHR